MSLLVVQHCGIRFGGLKALNEVNLSVSPGDLVGLIGPNGAGKTTLFNLLTGVYVPTMGSIHFEGQSLAGLSPYQISRLGIARTFQNIRLFNEMSVLDNVLVAFHSEIKSTLFQSIGQGIRYQKEEVFLKEQALALLHKLGLSSQALGLAKNLSYGDQRRLEMARALATKPRLLLLDEPAAGMNTAEKKALIDLIQRLRQEFSLTLLLIEHDMEVVMTLCPHIVVLDYGEVIARGTPAEIREHPRVIEAYLGAVHA